MILESSFKCSAANLHDVHTLSTGVNLLLGSETASRADNMAEAVEHSDSLALGIRDHDVVVRRLVNRDQKQARILLGDCSKLTTDSARRRSNSQAANARGRTKPAVVTARRRTKAVMVVGT